MRQIRLNISITGGAGFIGRWITKRLLDDNNVRIIDDFSNSMMDNISEFNNNDKFELIIDSILNEKSLLKSLDDSDICLHLASKINVQESLDEPYKHLINNYFGTYNLLEACRIKDIPIIIFGTCMVYDLTSNNPISEDHKVLPKSPYAATKLAAEELALSYHYGYGLPVTIVRVFNTYGPYQKSTSEGGVVSVFIKNYLEGNNLYIYGSGQQTRDLLYVEDCSEFVLQVLLKAPKKGEIYNAGSGIDISMTDLANKICSERERIKYIPHIHPQSEIMKLVCDYSKAKRELKWEPKTSLEEGLKTTMDWMKGRL